MPAFTARLAAPAGDATAQGSFSLHESQARSTDPPSWWTLSHQPERDMRPHLAGGRQR